MCIRDRVYKVIQPHEQPKPHQLARGFTLACLFTEDPVTVNDEEQYMRENARHRDGEYRFGMEHIISNGVADIRAPKKDIARKLQLDELDYVAEQRLLCFRLHFHA
jgi:hypothetical protein